MSHEKKYLLVSLSLVFIAACFFFGCIKEEYDFERLKKTEWTPDIALPIVSSSLTLKDILADFDSTEVFVEDATGFLTLIYSDNLVSVRADDLVGDIPDQSTNQNFTLSLPQIDTLKLIEDSVNVQIIENYTFGTPTDPGGDTIEIKTLIPKKGDISFTLNSDFQHSGTLNILIPNATLAGVPFQMNMPFSYTGVFPVIAAGSLAGYTIDLSAGGTSYNTLPIIYTITLYNSGNPVTTSDAANIKIDFKNFEFSYLDGYVGMHIITMPKDSVNLNIEIFNSVVSGKVFFEEPKVIISIANSFGVPVDAVFTTFEAWSPVQGTVPVSAPAIIPGPVSAGAPSAAGQVKNTVYSFDKATSNIQQIIDISPQYIFYAVSGQLNPAGNTGTPGFITDSSKLDVDVELQLPIFGYIINLVLQDSLPFQMNFNVDTAKNSDFEVESATIVVTTVNGFPVDAEAQVYFTDTIYKIIDSLYYTSSQKVMNSGIVGPAPAYKVVQPSVASNTVFLDKARIERLNKAKNIIVRGKLITSKGGTELVKMYSQYALEIKMGVRANIKAKF